VRLEQRLGRDLPPVRDRHLGVQGGLHDDLQRRRGRIKVTVTLSNGQTGDDILAFSNVDASKVWVGPQLVQYERNPQIMQNCA
jgi:hypothetical protein